SRPHFFSEEEIHFLSLAAGLVSLAVVAALYRERLHCVETERESSDTLSSESSQWTRNGECGAENERSDLARSNRKFPEIVGTSSALHDVLRQVEIVAPTDSCVLIGGETGTGKELIARAIHHLSDRRDRPFVKVNCAAIPSGLLESELFGHEKGAFTGAIARKAGRFEIADSGTLFLDEVGDIPLEMQPKLLRVLQEREFERLGSTRTQKVNVRVIAATHRDLPQMLQDCNFRADLYYRLNVFPITMPALRDRREDIPGLVRYYVDIYAGRMKRHIGMIPAHAMKALMGYSWPGNVRELQNFIERSVILSPGKVLRSPLSELKECVAALSGAGVCTLEEAEREHVIRALRESNWVIGGSNGAAARLGMKRTTLAYRIRKLKIPVGPRKMHRSLSAGGDNDPSAGGPPSIFEALPSNFIDSGTGERSCMRYPALPDWGNHSGNQQVDEINRARSIE
ncbi:MAG: sigma 54-interacting transcriptional regulator, partial [Acidobacteriaceae bacterium]|nr:sigma 54-interacting transcriptional regulator [Acidobacteriaceae bacterium]